MLNFSLSLQYSITTNWAYLIDLIGINFVSIHVTKQLILCLPLSLCECESYYILKVRFNEILAKSYELIQFCLRGKETEQIEFSI